MERKVLYISNMKPFCVVFSGCFGSTKPRMIKTIKRWVHKIPDSFKILFLGYFNRYCWIPVWLI